MVLNPCVAHRGWSGSAPENTLAAIRLALNDEAIEMIEVDVQLTKDAVPVLMHDFTLERTTNGTGMVRDYTFEELQQLDAGSWFDPQFSGEKIPTLEEVLQLTKGRVILNIELKKMGLVDDALEQKVVTLIQKHNMHADVVVTSFNHWAVKEVKQLDPQVKVGIIVYGQPTLIVEQMEEVGADVLALAYPYLNDELIKQVLSHEKEVVSWTVDELDLMQRIANLDPAIKICTNRPEVWKQLKQASLEGHREA